jgi:hypothetical protein
LAGRQRVSQAGRDGAAETKTCRLFQKGLNSGSTRSAARLQSVVRLARPRTCCLMRECRPAAIHSSYRVSDAEAVGKSPRAGLDASGQTERVRGWHGWQGRSTDKKKIIRQCPTWRRTQPQHRSPAKASR